MIDRQRVQQCPAFLLHQRPFRDSSQIVELLTADHGRVALVARGVKRARAKHRPALQPFQPLSVSWTLRSELGTLTGAESDGSAITLTGDALLAGFYISELILKLTHRHDPQPGLFRLYGDALAALARGGDALEASLRRFELRLLEELGYGLELNFDGVDGRPLDAATYYRVVADGAPLPVSGPSRHDLVFPGSALLEVAREAFDDDETCKIAQRITRAAIDRCLDGQTLNTRKVLVAMRARTVTKESLQ
ncbi:MAG: DNA repair protein RecO [Pseudomonadota bacterium]